jgi:hypothetical protein
MGAATVMTNERISTSTLSAEVANLNQNYLKYRGKVQLRYSVADAAGGAVLADPVPGAGRGGRAERDQRDLGR